MTGRRQRLRSAGALLAACALLQSTITPLSGAQAPAQTAAKRPASPAPPPDGGWPRDFGTATGGAIRIYQPQIASWDGQTYMVAYAAISYSASGAEKPALGTAKIEAQTAVSVSERLVNFSNIKLTETKFAGLPENQLREVV